MRHVPDVRRRDVRSVCRSRGAVVHAGAASRLCRPVYGQGGGH
jgi:hypothetical protein